jgi:FkbH-like protein
MILTDGANEPQNGIRDIVTITEALKEIQKPSREADPFELTLVCGFTPLHLKTLTAGHLQRRLPHRLIRIGTGIFGDLTGTLEALATKAAGEGGPDAAALLIEWADLDPRLGFREGGRWSPAALPDILTTVRDRFNQLALAIGQLPTGFRLAVSLPGLPLPPIFHAVGWQATEGEALLDTAIGDFAALVAARGGVGLVNARALAEDSPVGSRYDLKSDLLTGFPYTLAHADAVAFTISRLVSPSAPKKGIISDLDDTMWYGLVGETGPEGVSWDLASHHYLHALYQKLLSSLSEEGLLVGIASKNDPAVVEIALKRSDLYIDPDRIFPVEVNWYAKSGSVDRILKAWNISADSVVFVDDNLMELAEVAAEHPGIECIQFPRDDYAAGYAMLRNLRGLFGKERLATEDSLRLDSIRSGAEFRASSESGAASESFLQTANASIKFDFQPSARDSRALELVNKTNQFNLNGLRYTEEDWRRAISKTNSFLATVSYEDKFGPLGKIAVMLGVRDAEILRISSWVMSCRAFARRIEHQCLQILFERSAVRSVVFDFVPTPRNGPLQDFFESICGSRKDGPFEVTREQFESKRPLLYHKTFVMEHSSTNG